MLEYFFNFFVWWYLIVVHEFYLYVQFRYKYFLVWTRTYPMFKYFFTPLFGISNPLNRVISLFIRFWWVVFGGIISTILIVPFIITLLIASILPFVPIIQILVALLT